MNLIEKAAVDSADCRSYADKGQPGEAKELMLGLALVLCLVILEATAVGTFLSRLAHVGVEESANVFWVQSHHGY